MYVDLVLGTFDPCMLQLCVIHSCEIVKRFSIICISRNYSVRSKQSTCTYIVDIIASPVSFLIIKSNIRAIKRIANCYTTTFRFVCGGRLLDVSRQFVLIRFWFTASNSIFNIVYMYMYKIRIGFVSPRYAYNFLNMKNFYIDNKNHLHDWRGSNQVLLESSSRSWKLSSCINTIQTSLSSGQVLKK